MESIVEFALYTWVAVSILAVLVQLVRILRYRMSNAAKSDARSAEADDATIDLQTRMRTSQTGTSATSTEELATSTEELATSTEELATSTEELATSTEELEALEKVEQRVSAVASSGAAPTPPARPDAATPPGPPPAAPPAPPGAMSMPFDVPAIPDPSDDMAGHTIDVPSGTESTTAAVAATAVPSANLAPTANPARTLADILTGVRLPWNLLPTVDEAREPSNDRVVLLTDGVEPAEVGADVADELERLGFAITTRGEDTAIATRGDDVLGLQIIPLAGNETVGTAQRFPSASPTSVALDIWVEN